MRSEEDSDDRPGTGDAENLAKELRLAEDDLLRQGLRSFLKHQLRAVKAGIFTISGRYGVSSVEEVDIWFSLKLADRNP